MATTNSIIASAKAECDLTSSDEQGGSTPELVAWVGEDYAALMREVVKACPTRHRTFEYRTIPDGSNFVNLVSAGGNADFVRVGRLDTDGKYKTIPPADDNFQFDAPRICWNQGRTATTSSLNVWPMDQAPGDYVIFYIPSLTLPGSASADIDIPPGFEKILAQELCLHIKRRLELPTGDHEREIERLWKKLGPTLKRTLQTPQVVSDYDDSDY